MEWNGTALVPLTVRDSVGVMTAFIKDTEAVVPPAPAPAVTTTITTQSFAASSTPVPNPDRGWFRYTESVWNDAAGSGFTPLSSADLAASRTGERTELGSTIRHSTLVFRYYIMSYMRGVDTLPAAFLTAVSNDFAAARTAGVKLIPRFVYSNDGSTGSNSDTAGPYGTDTTPARTIGHVQQLTATVNAGADVIHAVQTGFIGTWGEWYYTDNWGNKGTLTQADWDNRAKLITAMLGWDPRIKLLIRYPGIKYRYLREGSGNGWVAPDGAADRLGFHNDAFLAPFNDYGTYHTFPDGQSVEQLKAYVAAETLRGLPMLGESASSADSGTTYAVGKSRMIAEHWNSLNPLYHPEVLNTWSQANKDEAGLLMGYRFRVTTATLPTAGPASASVNVTVNLANDGWGAVTMARPLQLVFTSGSTVVTRTLTGDLRTVKPGTTATITSSVQLPSVEGSYSLHLAMPDPNLPSREEYAIRLANTTSWANGRNGLGVTTTVGSAGEGGFGTQSFGTSPFGGA